MFCVSPLVKRLPGELKALLGKVVYHNDMQWSSANIDHPHDRQEVCLTSDPILLARPQYNDMNYLVLNIRSLNSGPCLS